MSIERDLTTLKIVEIGATPYVKRVLPEQTIFFSTFAGEDASRLGANAFDVSIGNIAKLWRALQDRDVSLIVCQPTFFSPWHWQSIGRLLFSRRALTGRLSAVQAFGPQMLRASTVAPIAILDAEDLPCINRNNFFLLDRCVAYFKRELPADRWRVFLKTGHPNLPTARFRGDQHYAKWLSKLRPISLGLPHDRVHFLPQERVEKTADIFFAGRIEGSSSVRATGIAELMQLKDRGLVIDIPSRRLEPHEFYRRCASAWLTWSPEGYGWDCFRHYEAAACHSVPLISQPTIERYQPMLGGTHAIYYDIEAGGLTRAALAALQDKTRLQTVAAAAREHVLAHHTPSAIVRHVVETALRLRTV